MEPYEEKNPDIWAKFSGAGNLYEYWVELKIMEENKLGNNYVGSLCNPNKMIIPKFSTPQEYWDKGKYKNENFDPDTTLPANGKENVGLAEYTSANYLSKYAMFTDHYDHDHKKYFPYPREECLDKELKETRLITAEDGKPDLVRYVDKISEGEIFDGDPFGGYVGYSYMWETLDAKGDETDPGMETVWGKLCYILDDTIHEAYAERLLPRTVAYAAGFLNYFFRGKMDLISDDETGSGYVLENQSEEDMDGTFTLCYDNEDDERVQLWEGTLAISAGSKSENIGDITPPKDAGEPGKPTGGLRPRLRTCRPSGACLFSARIPGFPLTQTRKLCLHFRSRTRVSMPSGQGSKECQTFCLAMRNNMFRTPPRAFSA